MTSNRIIVGMTGATGAIYGVRLLEVLAGGAVETHLVASDWARKTIAIETDRRVELHLVPVVDALLDRAMRRVAAPELEEAGHLSHRPSSP